MPANTQIPKFGCTILGSGSLGNATVIHGPEGQPVYFIRLDKDPFSDDRRQVRDLFGFQMMEKAVPWFDKGKNDVAKSYLKECIEVLKNAVHKRPQFTDRCPWDELTVEDWSRILRFCPSFADKCPQDILNDETIENLVHKKNARTVF